MKFNIERGPLLQLLTHVQAVVERRATIPVLANILLTAEGSTLTALATDLDLEARETVEATVTQPGSITVPAQTLFDIVRKLPDGSVIEFELAGIHMNVAAGRSRFRLNTLPAADFPKIVAEELPLRFTLPADEFARMLNGARYAISSDDTRYYLMGVYLHSKDDQLHAVATDGHRLVRMSEGKPADVGDVHGVIIPRKAVAEAMKLVDIIEDDVIIEMSATKARFHLGNAVLTTKLIDGTFPDYERVIPKNNKKKATVAASALAEAIDRVSTIATERTRTVALDFASDKLTVSMISQEMGNAVEEVEVEYDGNPLRIGFNSRYLLDVLSQHRGNTIDLMLDTDSSPTLVIPKGSNGNLAVVMPMRT